MLLDFDGTLSPLAPHPSLAEIDHESDAALRNLATNPNTYLAIISGRSAEDAREKVKLEQITYAGNHGLEIIFWNKSRYHHEIDEETRQNYEKMVTELETTVCVNLMAKKMNKKKILLFIYSSLMNILIDTIS